MAPGKVGLGLVLTPSLLRFESGFTWIYVGRVQDLWASVFSLIDGEKDSDV